MIVIDPVSNCLLSRKRNKNSLFRPVLVTAPRKTSLKNEVFVSLRGSPLNDFDTLDDRKKKSFGSSEKNDNLGKFSSVSNLN